MHELFSFFSYLHLMLVESVCVEIHCILNNSISKQLSKVAAHFGQN